MTREQLRQLSKGELIEIILGQQVLIEQLKAQAGELAVQVESLTRPAKDCANSSVPPSESRKPNRGGRTKTSAAPSAGIGAAAATAANRTSPWNVGPTAARDAAPA